MIFRVEVVRSVRQFGVVQIKASSAEEARQIVEREGNRARHGMLAPEWKEDRAAMGMQIVSVQEEA